MYLRIVLKPLREHKFYAKFSIYEFWSDQVIFLSHVISGNGIEVDLAKVKAILFWEQPKNITKIRFFFVLARYYRRFVLDFSQTVASMTKLL